jgi:hypothetical protein
VRTQKIESTQEFEREAEKKENERIREIINIKICLVFITEGNFPL